MKPEALVQRFEQLTQKMIEIMKAKNNDYSGGRDALKNFRRHGPYGIVVRMDDKLSRLDSFYNPEEKVELQVKAETADDTAMDLANYALLLIVTAEDERAKVENR